MCDLTLNGIATEGITLNITRTAFAEVCGELWVYVLPSKTKADNLLLLNMS